MIINSFILAFKNCKGNLLSSVIFCLFQIILFSVLISSIVIMDNFNGDIKSNALDPDASRTLNFIHRKEASITTKDIVIQLKESNDVKKTYIKKDTNNVIVVVAKDNDSIGAIREKLSKYNISETSSMQKTDFTAEYEIIIKVLKAMICIILVFVAISLFVFVIKAINSRSNQFAVYKALGYKTYYIYCIVVFENVIITLVSIFSGFLLGILITKCAFQSFLAKLIEVPELKINIAIYPIIEVFIAALMIIMLACLIAIKSYSKISTAILFKEE